MKKNVLIIGGSGGLSSVVARKLLENYNVYAVTRGKRELPPGVKSIIADRNSSEFEKAIISQGIKWDAVIDCICMNEEHAVQDIKVISKVSNRLIVVSTDSVYDPSRKSIPQTEEGFFIEEEGTTVEVSYGCNKRRMEVAFSKVMARKGSKSKDFKNESESFKNESECFFAGSLQNDVPDLNITIFRPGHIYGPGFLLGCFPENSRQKELPEIIKSGKPVNLVGMGIYAIQPIYVDDLARVMVDCIDNEKCFNEIFCIGGPEAVENRKYYECIAKALNVELTVNEVPLKGYVEAHPEYAGHLNHRAYDLSKLKATGIKLPDTPLEEGIRLHLRSLGYI